MRYCLRAILKIQVFTRMVLNPVEWKPFRGEVDSAELTVCKSMGHKS